MFIYLKILFLLLFSIQEQSTVSKNKPNSSIASYVKQSQNKTLTLKQRLSFIDSAYILSTQLKHDTLLNETLKEYVKLSFKTKDWNSFHNLRREHLHLTQELNDTSAYAKTLEYSGAYFMNHHKMDSAYYFYYESFKMFNAVKDSLKAGRILINLATLQKRNHDYTGSEITSFKAIEYLKSSNNYRRISSAYNNLGLIYEQLNDIENALKYHTKALALRKQIKDTPIYQIHSYNNIGLIHTKNGNFDNAITYYKQALAFDSILQKQPILKAYIIDNYTYAQFKNGNRKHILNRFLEALSIREKEQHISGIIISCIHLAEYYKTINDTSTALQFAKRAENLSKSIKNYEDYLMAIELLSSLYTLKEDKDAHFKTYIKIRDSLDLVARTHKEQFARIRFESNEKDKTILNQQSELTTRKNTLFVVYGIISITVLIIIGFYLYRLKKAKQLNIQFKEGFGFYLKNKYGLTDTNLEFWQMLVTGASQEDIANTLHISIAGVKSRRRTLKIKIQKKTTLEGDFDKAKAIILYNKELELYHKTSKN